MLMVLLVQQQRQTVKKHAVQQVVENKANAKVDNSVCKSHRNQKSMTHPKHVDMSRCCTAGCRTFYLKIHSNLSSGV